MRECRLYPRHKIQTRNPAETTENRYKIEILMSRTQKLKGLFAALLRVKTLNDNPYVRVSQFNVSARDGNRIVSKFVSDGTYDSRVSP